MSNITHGGVQKLCSITLPEHDCSQDGPDLRVPPMLGQDICWIDLTRKVVERNDASSDGFPNEVISQGMMSLFERGMRLGGTRYD